MGQRLGIAAALLGDPRTLILDEPVNGLDPEGVQWVRQLVRALAAEGRTVFLSSHLMSEMSQTADHLLVIGRGRIIEPGGGAGDRGDRPGRARHRQRAGRRADRGRRPHRLGSPVGASSGRPTSTARWTHAPSTAGATADTSTTTVQCGRALYAARPWPSALAATDEPSRINARARANRRAGLGGPPAEPHERPGGGARIDDHGQQPREPRGEPAQQREVPQRGEAQHGRGDGDDREQDGEDASGGHRTPPRTSSHTCAA